MGTTKAAFKDINATMNGFIPEFTEEFLARVQRRTPVATGELRDAWVAEIKPSSISITNNKEYASPVEYGTRFMPPVGMLRTTVAEANDIAIIAKRRASK